MFLGNHRSKLNLRPRVGDESKRSIQRRPVTKDWRDIKRSEAKKILIGMGLLEGWFTRSRS